MRLRVAFKYNVNETRVAWYSITPVTSTGGLRPNTKLLGEKIKKMAQAVLGKDFRHIIDMETHIDMCVRLGTSRGPKRFDFRALCGWIELFPLS